MIRFVYLVLSILFLLVSYAFAEPDSIWTVQGKEVQVISSIRADDDIPITQKTFSTTQIREIYYGQEVPSFLSYTPSMQFYSDMGTGYGYSYFRLRGIDQTRINATLDGVPLNEPEDQGVYFNNYVDFLSSVASVQIQRGVGTTTNGVASYGGSINFQSNSLTRKATNVRFGFGSYKTRQFMGEYSSGLTENKFGLNIRVSKLDTEGYRYNSAHDGTSVYLSTGHINTNYMLKYTTFYGIQNNDMAYLATSIDDIKIDRRINYLSPDEKDHFKYWFNSLQFVFSHFNNTVYFIKLRGNYDVLLDEMYNFNLDSYFIGNILNFNYKFNRFDFYTGIHFNTYKRKHFLKIIEIEQYRNFGVKNEISYFAKLNYLLTSDLNIYGDIQFRWTTFDYTGDIPFEPIEWNFINPKLGVNYKCLYASIGKTNREPTRNDLFNGDDNLTADNLTYVYSVSPESVVDVEIGSRYESEKLAFNLNFYSMKFTNEIAAIGQLSYIGLPLRKNVPKSRRYGIEADVEYQLNRQIRVKSFVSYNKANIDEYFVEYENKTYRDVVPLLSPEIISNNSIMYRTGNFNLSLLLKYVGDSYLDNENTTKMPGFVSADVMTTVSLDNFYLRFICNNLFNRDYYNSGYLVDGKEYYYVNALRNFMIEIGF